MPTCGNPWSGYPATPVLGPGLNGGESAFFSGGLWTSLGGMGERFTFGGVRTDPDSSDAVETKRFDANLQWGPTKGFGRVCPLAVPLAVVQQFGGDVHDLTISAQFLTRGALQVVSRKRTTFGPIPRERTTFILCVC